MALYAIGDLHLSLSVNKPMDVFGPGWANHVQRLEEAFSQLTAEDVTVLCGDTSWGMALRESLEDFLSNRVFAGVSGSTAAPDGAEAAAFGAYIQRYKALLQVERAAAELL